MFEAGAAASYAREPVLQRVRAILHGADDGHRTRDIHLGRVALCQLSYIRIWAVGGTFSRLSMPPRQALTPEDLASWIDGRMAVAAALRPCTRRHR